MVVRIIGTLIGALVLGFGIYYFVKEKHDGESRKIYGTISAIGAIIFVVMLVLTILAIC